MTGENNFAFDQKPDLEKMKQSIADRSFNIKMKGMLISGGLMVLGLGAMFVFPGALGVLTPVLGLAAAAGGALSGLATMKEAKKLQIDEEFLESRMQGKNYWGGYKEEVGQGPANPALMGTSAPVRGAGRDNSR